MAKDVYINIANTQDNNIIDWYIEYCVHLDKDKTITYTIQSKICLHIESEYIFIILLLQNLQLIVWMNNYNYKNVNNAIILY